MRLAADGRGKSGGHISRIVGINAGSLDDPSWFRPQFDIFASDAQPWDQMDPAIPKYDKYHREVEHPPARSSLSNNRVTAIRRTSPSGHSALEQSADDTAALLEYLHADRADTFGFSNGGTIALQVAIRHPRVVRSSWRRPHFSAATARYPSFWESMKNARLEMMPKELREAYRKVAPHPENLRVLFIQGGGSGCATSRTSRTTRSARSPRRHWSCAAIRTSSRPEHAVALTRLLLHAQLAILPATDHAIMITRVDWLVPMVEAFPNAADAAGQVSEEKQ